jgi:diacylglycerol kinase family enzyme
MPPIRYDTQAPLQFVINGASGQNDADTKRAAIEAALARAGRRGELHVARPQELAQVARECAATACASGSAVVAVGGDGTINTVAQAAHGSGCAMGVMPQGTFNYFARTHGIPPEPAEAAAALLAATPRPVQIGLVNRKVFLVNASLGLYPELLQDREAYKARFGRSRPVALVSGLVTLLREHRQLRLRIERGGVSRDVRTPTLFVGNNRLQLEQIGVRTLGGVEQGCVAAVMLRPIGTLAMLGLLLRGALGSLGEADDVETFGFDRMVVQPSLKYGTRRIKVAVDGEVLWMDAPLRFEVAEVPLYLLAPERHVDDGESAE